VSPARKAKPRRYAEGTKVPVDDSRSELERLLNTHGATSFGVYREPARWVVLFQLAGRYVRHEIEVPKATRSAPDPDREVRRKWRAIVLITKAKLELIAGGDSTIEREFLADTVLADGSTVYNATRAQIADSYSTGVTPRLLGAGGP
jgi:hypothetical protein